MMNSKTTFLLLLVRLSAAWPAPAAQAVTNPSPLGPLIPVATNSPTIQSSGLALAEPSVVTTTMIVISGSDFVPSFSSDNLPAMTTDTPASTGPAISMFVSSTGSQVAAISQPTSSTIEAKSPSAATGIILGSTLGGIGALFTLFCLFIFFCDTRRRKRVMTQRYSDFSISDRKPMVQKEEFDISRSASKASNTDTNRTFWRDSGTFIEPLDFQLGPIDGSGRLSKLSFASIFNPNEIQPLRPMRRDWPLVSEPLHHPEQQIASETNWTSALFPMPPPVKLRDGPIIYNQPVSSKSSTTVALPDNLGKLNNWLRDNRRREGDTFR